MKHLVFYIFVALLSACAGATPSVVLGTEGDPSPPLKEREICLIPHSLPPSPPKSILFAVGSFAIEPSQDALIKNWVSYILRIPDKRYSIEGHTDDTGGHESNFTLGKLRAITVYRRLMELKAPSEQLSIETFGEELPHNPAFTEAARRENRRVSLWEKPANSR